MIRFGRCTILTTRRIPRESGDDPYLFVTVSPRCGYSPRERG